MADAIGRRGTIVLANAFFHGRRARHVDEHQLRGAPSRALRHQHRRRGCPRHPVAVLLCLGFRVMFALSVPLPLVLAAGVLTNNLVL